MNEKAGETIDRNALFAEREKLVARILEIDKRGCESGSDIDNSRGSAEWQEAAARFREIDNLLSKKDSV